MIRDPNPPLAPSASSRGRFGLAAAGLLLLIVLGQQQLGLLGEAAAPAPFFSDNVLHLSLVREAAAAMERGDDPTDFWYAPVTSGYPLFHHYQHLPHVVLAGVGRLLGGAVPLDDLFRWSVLLMLLLFPLSVAGSVRALGYPATAAVFAGVAAALLSTDGLYGLDASSYGWGGFGMTTQLWGMVLLGPAWALGRRAVQEGRGVVLTAAVFAALVLSHTVLGYVAVLSTAVFILAPGPRGLVRRLVRAALVLGLAGIAASYFLVPFLLDRAAMNRSVWELPEKYASYGWEMTLSSLMQGKLLDDPMYSPGRLGANWPGRLPVLTLLAFAGVVVSLWRGRRDAGMRVAPLLFLGWLLLYFGPKTWGGALAVLPMSDALHFHRLIAPVHLAAAVLAGVGLGAGWDALSRRGTRGGVALAFVLAAGVLAPAVLERAAYYSTRAGWRESARAAFRDDAGQLASLVDRAVAEGGGRVFAGTGGGWGKDYRIGAVPVHAQLLQRGAEQLGYLYHALSRPADVEGFFDASRPSHWNLFNVRHAIAPASFEFRPFVQIEATAGRHRLFRVETEGWFDLVDVPLAFRGAAADWYPTARTWLESRLVDLGLHPAFFLGESPRGRPVPVFPLDEKEAAAEFARIAARGAPAARGTVQRLETDSRAGRFAARVEVKRPCYLLLKCSFHPGWRVEVDGRVAETVRLAPAFVGVAVESGAHEVRFTYQPRPIRTPLRWGGIAVLILAAVVEAWLRRRRRRTAPQPS